MNTFSKNDLYYFLVDTTVLFFFLSFFLCSWKSLNCVSVTMKSNSSNISVMSSIVVWCSWLFLNPTCCTSTEKIGVKKHLFDCAIVFCMACKLQRSRKLLFCHRLAIRKHVHFHKDKIKLSGGNMKVKFRLNRNG